MQVHAEAGELVDGRLDLSQVSCHVVPDTAWNIRKEASYDIILETKDRIRRTLLPSCAGPKIATLVEWIPGHLWCAMENDTILWIKGILVRGQVEGYDLPGGGL